MVYNWERVLKASLGWFAQNHVIALNSRFVKNVNKFSRQSMCIMFSKKATSNGALSTFYDRVEICG